METLRGQSPGCPSQGMAFCSPSSFRSGMVGGSDSARESPEITFLWDTGPQPGEISKGASGQGLSGGKGQPGLTSGPAPGLLWAAVWGQGISEGHSRGCMVGPARSGQARSGRPSGGSLGRCVELGGSVETAEGETGPTGALSSLPLIWVLPHSQAGSSQPHAWA